MCVIITAWYLQHILLHTMSMNRGNLLNILSLQRADRDDYGFQGARLLQWDFGFRWGIYQKTKKNSNVVWIHTFFLTKVSSRVSLESSNISTEKFPSNNPSPWEKPPITSARKNALRLLSQRCPSRFIKCVHICSHSLLLNSQAKGR